MPLINKQKAILHEAMADRKLSEAEYRAALVHVAGVTSSTELDRAGIEVMMGFLEYLGFAPLRKSGPDYGTRPGMASFAQLEFIRSLWTEWNGMVAPPKLPEGTTEQAVFGPDRRPGPGGAGHGHGGTAAERRTDRVAPVRRNSRRSRPWPNC
jgi:hypothetical protein